MYDSETNILKLIDFGSALRYDNLEISQRRRVGTVIYVLWSLTTLHQRLSTENTIINAIFGHWELSFISFFVVNLLSKAKNKIKF